MARVKLEGVRKVYENGYTAVHGVDFEVADGEFVVLVGPSGCGKSTTLRMIAGLESISEGKLYIGDRAVNDVPARDRDIAMVFQNYALYPHMSVFDNLAFGLKLRKRPKPEIREQVHRAAEILGITGILDRKPRQLSGGQRQRVALGRAIVREPRVFLFDEPLSNLDAKLRVQMRKEISKLHRQLDATMIYVTHDQVEAMTMGDRIVVLNEGYIQQIDTPLNLYEHPVNRFVAGFIGSPGMNFVTGMIARTPALQFQTPGADVVVPLDGRVERLGSYEGRELILGIRPEHISLAEHGASASPDTAVATVNLDVIEPMGNESIVYTHLPANEDVEIVARIHPQRLPEPGETLRVDLDVNRMHFFDPDSGLAV